EFLVLGLALEDGLFQLDEILAPSVGGAIHPAAFKAACFVYHAGDQGRVADGTAHADIGMLAQADRAALQQGQAVGGGGHAGHDAHASDQAVPNRFCDAAVDALTVPHVVGAEKQLFHRVLSPSIRLWPWAWTPR